MINQRRLESQPNEGSNNLDNFLKEPSKKQLETSSKLKDK
jgi:hypothetical protein